MNHLNCETKIEYNGTKLKETSWWLQKLKNKIHIGICILYPIVVDHEKFLL